jgi:two-component system, response regulator PdtaR
MSGASGGIKVTGAIELSRPRSLLIADDDVDHSAVLCDLFASRGFRTLVASDGQEAIRIALANPVDCLVFDVHMPILSGIDALRIIRHKFVTPLPCIFVTAANDPGIEREARILQAFSVLFKPVSCPQITGAVLQALRSVG